MNIMHILHKVAKAVDAAVIIVRPVAHQAVVRRLVCMQKYHGLWQPGVVLDNELEVRRRLSSWCSHNSPNQPKKTRRMRGAMPRLLYDNSNLSNIYISPLLYAKITVQFFP